MVEREGGSGRERMGVVGGERERKNIQKKKQSMVVQLDL